MVKKGVDNLTLSQGTIGSSYKICSMDLPINIKRRLEALGMTKDTYVSVINMKAKGVAIIKVRQTRFALGRNITNNIEVCQ